LRRGDLHQFHTLLLYWLLRLRRFKRMGSSLVDLPEKLRECEK
jgi:hypothetical protein